MALTEKKTAVFRGSGDSRFLCRGTGIFFCLQGKRHRILIQFFQDGDEGGEGRTAVRLVGAEHTGEGFLAVKRNPCKLAAVIVQKTGSEADAFAGGDIGQGGVMIRTVEIADVSGGDEPVLHSLERRR